jgi:hypothetical protein
MRCARATDAVQFEAAFNPYDDDEITGTVAWQADASAQALMNLRNIYSMVVVRSNTLPGLRAYMLLDQRLGEESSDICARMETLISADTSYSELLQMPAQAAMPPGYSDIWKEWLDVAYARLGRVPDRQRLAEDAGFG